VSSDRASLWRATGLVALSAACFGSVSPLTLVAQREGAALEAIQTVRYLTTAVVLIAWSAVRGTRGGASVAARQWYDPRVMFVAGGGQMAVATLALTALRWIPAATEAFLFYTYPAWVAVITASRGSERLDRARIFALVLALSGIALMVGAPDAQSLHPLGLASVLSGALLYAAYIPVLDRLQQGRSSLDVTKAIALGGGLLFLVWTLAAGTLPTAWSLRVVGASVLQGLLSAGAFLGFLAGLRTLGAVRTSITSTIEPFWTSILGIVLLGQPLGGGTIVGGVLIMGAVILLQRPAVATTGLDSSTVRDVPTSTSASVS
jgi:drug/metabolite transporter (DMT)-like permease